jgi:hypothetical protein
MKFDEWVFNRFGMGNRRAEYKELKETWSKAQKEQTKAIIKILEDFANNTTVWDERDTIQTLVLRIKKLEAGE